MKLRYFLVGAMLLTLTTVGCGGDSGDDSEARSDVQKQCDALMEHWCDKAVDCFVEGGIVSAAEDDDARNQCMSGLHALCDGAVEVRSNYEPCQDEITAMSCDTINTGYEDGSLSIPSICQGAIGVRP